MAGLPSYPWVPPSKKPLFATACVIFISHVLVLKLL
jgi:hypothetical protein